MAIMTAPIRLRAVALILCIGAALLTGCGNDELSMAEYAEQLDGIFERGIQQYTALVESPDGLVLIAGQGPHLGFDDGGTTLTDYTPQQLGSALTRLAAIQAEALETAASITPPEAIADLHALYFRELPIAALAERAAVATSWEDLSDSPEMAAYRSALAADNDVCAEFQTKLDSIAQQGAFVDVPWVPSRLTDIVDYALGCDALPPNPQDAYRP